jgi:hypothetical protein
LYGSLLGGGEGGVIECAVGAALILPYDLSIGDDLTGLRLTVGAESDAVGARVLRSGDVDRGVPATSVGSWTTTSAADPMASGTTFTRSATGALPLTLARSLALAATTSLATPCALSLAAP